MTTSKPKILFISDAKTYGGAEFYQASLARACLQRGWSTMMVLLDEPALNAWCEGLMKSGIEVLRYNIGDIADGSLNRKARAWNPDLIHTNGSNHPEYFRTIQAVHVGRACVLSEQAFPFFVPLTCSWWSALRTRLQRRHWQEKNAQWNFCDKIITANGIFRTVMIKNWGIAPDRVESICNGVDPTGFEPFDPARKNLLTILGQKIDSPIIITTGRMVWLKGFDLLLKAMAGLKSKNWHLVMVGDGEFLPNLKAQASALNIADRVHFTGHRSDLKTFLAGADIFVLPTRNEAIGFSILEAMSCQVASIGTAVGGVPEVLGDSEFGLLVPSENVSRLRRAIERLLTDVPLRKELGERGKKRILENFTLQQMIDKTLRIFEQLL
jgi:glycosyltransferase involved in cell wall biosynthesis